VKARKIMGSVTMKAKFLTNSPIDNYPEYDITDYIYCDKCGSFNIKEHKTFKTWIKIAVSLLIAVLGGATVLALLNVPSSFFVVLACIICFIFVFLAIDSLITIMSHETGHKCRKCGNTDINKHSNVLNYPEEDTSVLDVPDRSTHKHRRFT
jgi:hypothetical protein